MNSFIIQFTKDFTWRFEHYHVEDYETVGGVTHWDERRFLWFIVKYNIHRIFSDTDSTWIEKL